MHHLDKNELEALRRDFMDADGMDEAEACALAAVSVRVAPVESMRVLALRVDALMVEYARYSVLLKVWHAKILAACAAQGQFANLVDLGFLYRAEDWLTLKVNEMASDPFYQFVAAGQLHRADLLRYQSDLYRSAEAARINNQSSIKIVGN